MRHPTQELADAETRARNRQAASLRVMEAEAGIASEADRNAAQDYARAVIAHIQGGGGLLDFPKGGR
jgi:hypothetical protein